MKSHGREALLLIRWVDGQELKTATQRRLALMMSSPQEGNAHILHILATISTRVGWGDVSPILINVTCLKQCFFSCSLDLTASPLDSVLLHLYNKKHGLYLSYLIGARLILMYQKWPSVDIQHPMDRNLYPQICIWQPYVCTGEPFGIGLPEKLPTELKLCNLQQF